MARPRTRAAANDGEGNLKKLTPQDIARLGTICDMSRVFQGVGTNSAITVSLTEMLPNYLVKIYGFGSAGSFVAQNSGKTWWGWWIPLKERYTLLKFVQAQEEGTCSLAYTKVELDKYLYKLEKAINSGRGDDGAHDV
ncbi:MAG TPA: hypothetical protein VJT32_04120 [bacterium]|nr:hypothetical protein [bacterium]